MNNRNYHTHSNLVKSGGRQQQYVAKRPTTKTTRGGKNIIQTTPNEYEISKLPNKIIILTNKEKKGHESWKKKMALHEKTLKLLNKKRRKKGLEPIEKEFDKGNYPHPTKFLALANTNCGKTNIVKNVIIHQMPKFQKLVLIHQIHNSIEYDEFDIDKLNKLPPQDYFDTGLKTLVILDDLNFKGFNSIQKERLIGLYGAWCTHKKGYISVISCAQDFFQLPPVIKRMTDVYILWKPHDLTEINMMAPKVGLTPKILNEWFNTLCKTRYDHIVIDKTIDSPFPYRLNDYDIIKFKK